MTRAEAYWILHEMMVETFSADQSIALSMALHDIQLVDSMSKDKGLTPSQNNSFTQRQKE